MSVHTNLILSDQCHIPERDLLPFDASIQKAIDNLNIPANVYCDISVGGTIPPNIEDQFTKVGNLYIGFHESLNIDSSLRRAFIFECMALKDPILKTSQKIILLLSSTPVSMPGKNKSTEKEEPNPEEEDNAPSFVAMTPKYSLDKVILDDGTRDQINRSLALIKNQKLIFETWGFNEVDPNTKTILCFFGAPGTGKTMCAHAIAKQLNKRIIIASYASIESKWVGEGPKNMRKIFEDATEQDAILFFDEADSFLSKRVDNAETGSDKHYNRMSNEMFQLLEDFNGVVIFATNMVADFDKAFKSRILSFIEFRVPDYNTRKVLIKSMLPSKLPLSQALTESDYDTLSDLSDGFSGREIRKALLTSLSEAALQSKIHLAPEDLCIGFESVKDEREAIEKSAIQERQILSDFIKESGECQQVMNLCIWSLCRCDEIQDEANGHLYKISRFLNVPMPDTSQMVECQFFDKLDINLDRERLKEAFHLIIPLLEINEPNLNKRLTILEELCENLGIVEVNKVLAFAEYSNEIPNII